MAIRRCPYCKAIIDEQDKYCNNCGTQLLFPEDEFVEEEIKGDRIVDEDASKEEKLEEESDEEGDSEEEEEEEEEEEPDDEEEAEEEEDDDSGELEETDEGEEEDSEEDLGDEEEGEEEELEDEKDQLEMEAEQALGEGSRKQEAEEEEVEKERDEEGEEEEEFEAGEADAKLTPADKHHKKYQVSIEQDELVFKTKDLENLTGTVEEGKENLEEFLESRKKAEPTPLTSEKVPALFKDGESPRSPTKEILPPWASGMKESPPSTADLEEAEKGAEGKSTTQAPTSPGWTTDSGIGIPEKVTQAGLPSGTAAVPAVDVEKKEEMEAEEREEPAAGPAQRVGFSLKLKSKLVDLAFITALWLVTLWFTAQVIGVSFLRIIVGSPVPVLALLFILLLLYFFLFLYFLGETLGDHYFSEEE